MTDPTFGKHKKLRKTDEFSSVFRFRCGRRGLLLDVNAGPNGLGIARLGLIVPKKIISTAVGRNRVKRLLREWFRHNQDTLAGMDIIARLKGKAGANTLDEAVLKEDFHAGLATCRACLQNRLPAP